MTPTVLMDVRCVAVSGAGVSNACFPVVEDVARFAEGAGWDEVAVGAALRSVRGMLTEAYGQALGGLTSRAGYPAVDASVRAEWAGRFHDARVLLGTLGEDVRGGLLARAAEVMAGTHQAPPVVAGTEAGAGEGAAAYAELYEDMMALVAAATHSSSGQGWLTPDGWARAMSEELRSAFGTQAWPGFSGSALPEDAAGAGGLAARRADDSLRMALAGGSGPETGGGRDSAFLDEPRSASPQPVGQAEEAAARAAAGRGADSVAMPDGVEESVVWLDSVSSRLGGLRDGAADADRFELARGVMWGKNVELPPLPGGRSRAPAELLRTLQRALVVVIEEEGKAAAEALALRARDVLGLTAPRIPVLGGVRATGRRQAQEPDSDGDSDSDGSLFNSPGPSRRFSPDLALPSSGLALPTFGAALSELAGVTSPAQTVAESGEQAASAVAPASRAHTVFDADTYMSGQPSGNAVAALGAAAFLYWHVGAEVQIPWRRAGLAPELLSPAQVEEVFRTTRDNERASLGSVWEHVLATHEVSLPLEDLYRLHQQYHALGQATKQGRGYLSRMRLLFAARQYAVRHHGSIADVPLDHTEPVNGYIVDLGKLLDDARRAKSRVSKTTRTALDRLNMRWNEHTRANLDRDVYLGAVRQYADANGGSVADVPYGHIEPFEGTNVPLGHWLSNARYGQTPMDEETRVLLDRLGMRWASASLSRLEKFKAAAQKWADLHGGSIANVPETGVAPVNGEDVKLGIWLKRVRARSVKVDEETRDFLDRLDMRWGSWNDAKLVKFKAAARQWADLHGGSISGVPDRRVEVVNGEKVTLGTWLKGIRRWPGKVDEETRDFLDRLGMRWLRVPRKSAADPEVPGEGEVWQADVPGGLPGAAAVSGAEGARVAPAVPVVPVAAVVARRGLRMEEVPGDGDCLVVSLARVVELDRGEAWTGTQVREVIARELLNDLGRVPVGRRLWPLLEQAVLLHTAEVMAGSAAAEQGVAGLSWQERVTDSVEWLSAAGGVTDTHREEFAALVARPGQWMSSAGDAIPQIAALVLDVRIQITQVAVPAAGDPRVSAFQVGERGRIVRMVRQLHVTDEGRPAGEHWSPAVADRGLIAGLAAADLRLLSEQDPDLLSEQGPVVMRVETPDSSGVVRREMVNAFLTADEAGRERIGNILTTLSSPAEHGTVERTAPETAAVLAPWPEQGSSERRPPAPEGGDALLARLNPEVRPAVRAWEKPVAEEVEELKAILRTAGSRSLVFSTGLQRPVWALNLNGTVTWFSEVFAPVAAPRETHDRFFSIDINHHGQLTGPAARALRTAGAFTSSTVKTGYCDVTIGTDLSSVLGW